MDTQEIKIIITRVPGERKWETKRIVRKIIYDGEEHYSDSMSLNLYQKDNSILKQFTDWLMMYKKGESGGNVTRYTGYKANLFRYLWFKLFKLKHKFLKVLFQ